METTGGVRVRVHTQPRASRDEVAGLHGDALKIRIAASPVDGMANDALIDFLSRQLDIARSAVELASGHASRSKVVLIHGLTVPEVQSRLRL